MVCFMISGFMTQETLIIVRNCFNEVVEKLFQINCMKEIFLVLFIVPFRPTSDIIRIILSCFPFECNKRVLRRRILCKLNNYLKENNRTCFEILLNYVIFRIVSEQKIFFLE